MVDRRRRGKLAQQHEEHRVADADLRPRPCDRDDVEDDENRAHVEVRADAAKLFGRRKTTRRQHDAERQRESNDIEDERRRRRARQLLAQARVERRHQRNADARDEHQRRDSQEVGVPLLQLIRPPSQAARGAGAPRRRPSVLRSSSISGQ